MKRNSNRTIQEEEDSLQLNQNTEVHQYNLDYSDEENLNSDCGSSDDYGRDVSAQQLQNATKNPIFQNTYENLNKSHRYRKEDYFSLQKFKLSNKYDKNATNNEKSKKQSQFSPTYDSSFLKNENDRNYNKKNYQGFSNDPQKSSYKKNELYGIKNKSYNSKMNLTQQYLKENSKNDIGQFNIQNYMNKMNENSSIKNKLQKKNDKIFDQDFILITLPQVDSESSTIRDKNSIQIKKKTNKKKTYLKQDNQYTNQNLQWRYQQAKLNFVDNFMPQHLKIKKNPYNLLKYINHKRDFSFNLLSLSFAK